MRPHKPTRDHNEYARRPSNGASDSWGHPFDEFRKAHRQLLARRPHRRCDKTTASRARSAGGCIARAARPARVGFVRRQRIRPRTSEAIEAILDARDRDADVGHPCRREPMQRMALHDRLQSARHAAFSSTRNSALRARGFAATSAASARRARPIRCAAAIARPGTGNRRGNTSPSDHARNMRLTMRSSRL